MEFRKEWNDVLTSLKPPASITILKRYRAACLGCPQPHRRERGLDDRAPAKKEAHRALDDIRESIAELAYYRQHVLR
jgi:hypothetical protein